MGAVSVFHRRELQAQATAGAYMAHKALGPDLSFLDQKIKIDLFTHFSCPSRLNKQAGRTQIPNSRHLVTSITAPVDPNTAGYFDS